MFAGLSVSRQVMTNWRLGEATETVAGADAEGRAPELARHFCAGVAVGDPLRAAHWVVVAGKQSYQSAAFPEALGHADVALDLTDPGEGSGPVRGAAMALKVQALRRCGSPEEVDRLAASALDEAIALGDPTLIADVAAGGVGPLSNYDPARPSTG